MGNERPGSDGPLSPSSTHKAQDKAGMLVCEGYSKEPSCLITQKGIYWDYKSQVGRTWEQDASGQLQVPWWI